MASPVALVTGASRGIGKATAEKFAAEGYHIVITSHGSQELDNIERELIKTYAAKVLKLPGDLSNESHLDALITNIKSEFQRLDVVVNNAAWRTIETIRTIDHATWNKTIAINLTAPALLSRAAAILMEEQQTPGVIINISSVMSSRAGGNSPAYVACKGGLEALTRELAVTFGPSGIRAVCVAPGFIDTEMSGDYTDPGGENISAQMANELLNFTPLCRPGKPAEIAELIYWLCTASASFITGVSIIADGGFLANFNSYQLKKKLFPTQY